jgi:uncharacterized protein YjbI with pentapeptide repeats
MLPNGWKLVGGYLIGPGANLSNAVIPDMIPYTLAGMNLTGANFSGASISYANLTNANLTNANLTNANLRGTVLSGANLTGAKLVGANLTGTVSGRISGVPASLPTGWKLISGRLVQQ